MLIARDNEVVDEEEEEDLFYSLDLNHDPNIVRVFPIDYERLIQRLKHAKWFAAAASILFLGVGIWMHLKSGTPPSSLLDEDDDRLVPFAMSALFVTVFIGMYCTEGKNERRIRGQHVAATRVGIRRDAVDENGVQTTITIPWDQIRRVDRCSRDLVRIHTVAGHRTSNGKPTEIEGLHDVYDFVEFVNNIMDQVETAESIV